MDSENLNKYFTWLPVVNTAENRYHKEGSSTHILCNNKIRESTKQLNKYLQTHRPKNYSDFVKCKKKILSQITDNVDVTNEFVFSVKDCKTYYDSFDVTSARDSEVVPDDLFVWLFIEKKGLKKESVDAQKDPIWEPTMDIHIDDSGGQCDSGNKYSASLKAAGALLIKKEKLHKKCVRKIHYNTRNSSSFKNSGNSNTDCTDVLTETPKNVVEKANDSHTTVLRNKKLKNVKRNLRSSLDYVSSQVSETPEANLSCEFIPDDFQAQSTQIFSDTFTDGNAIKSSRRTRYTHKFPSSDAVNQPRDSGIEEDSRDENTKCENIAHQPINNEKENSLTKTSDKEVSSDRKTLGESKNKSEDSFSSENTESHNTPQKKCLKIIGDETLNKKYKIIAKDDRALQPIVEKKPAPSSELNDENNSCSKSESDKNSESDFKSIESDNEEESNCAEKTRESSEEYCDVHNENNALSSDDEKVSPAEKNVVKIGKVQTDQESNSQDSKHHRRRTKNQLKESTSPWITKQYSDLKRLRLLESSQDDSEVESHREDESANIAKQKLSIKSKKTSKNLANEIETLSKKSNRKSNKKKLFINGKLIKNSDSEMNDLEISNENIDDHRIIDVNPKKEKSIENSDHSNSKLDGDNREYSEHNSIDSHQSLQKSKKLKRRNKRQTSNRTDSFSSREHSNERQTQHDLNRIVKTYKDSSQSIKDDDSNENIHQSCEEDDAVPVLYAEKSTEQKTKSDYDNSEDSEENVDTLCSQNNISFKDSDALSVNNDVNSKQAFKENGLKREIFTSSDNEEDSEDEKTISENQQKQLQNFKKMDIMAFDESSDSKTESENVDLRNKNESPHHENEKSNGNIEKSSESDDDEIDVLETMESVLPFEESQSDESDKEDEGLPTLHAQKKLKKMKRLTFDGSSESEDSETDNVSVNKHKSQFIRAKEQNFKDKFEKGNGASSDETSDNEGTTSENQNKQLENLKTMEPVASGESSVNESEHQIVDSQSERKSSCHRNERTDEKLIRKSCESNDDRTDGQETKELILPQKESQSDESNKEDELQPTRQAQEKLQQMKRLIFDDSTSESKDSETEIVSLNKHKSQLIKSMTAKEQNFKGKYSEHIASSDEESDKEDTMSKNQENHLQQMKKVDRMSSDESSVSETEHKSVNSQSKKKSSCHRNERADEKSIRKSCESNDERTDGREKKEHILPQKESQSNESDKEDELPPTRYAQEKLQKMKRLNFDDSTSESEDSETEIVSVNKHKSQLIKSATAKEKIFKEKSGEHRASSDEESDEEDIMSENQKNHLQQMKNKDLMAGDKSDDSDEKDQISKCSSKKLLELNENDDEASDTAVRQQKKLHKKSRNADSNKSSDSDSVHCDSDIIDIKEHKVILPENLKNTNLLDHSNESNVASFSISKNVGKTESLSDRKDVNDEDEEIDNIVPVEVSKRMQQLKRLNLYENDDSSDSDESLTINRNNVSISQKLPNVSRKEHGDSTSDEKESVNEEPLVSTSKLNESELNELKKDVQDNVADQKESDIAVVEKNINVIIPETQESEYFVSDDNNNNNQSQDMFSSLEDLSENPSRISPTPQPVSKQPTPTKPNREKITQIEELVEQEELMKIDLEPTMTLNDVSDDEDIIVIEVPKSVFNRELIGKKLIVTNSTCSIGNSHYEAIKKDTPPIMSCVLNSKRNKFKTVNIRPVFSIVARRKKNADDFIENADIENRHENLTAMKNQCPMKESEQESVNEARDIEQPSTKKSKLKKEKSSQIDKTLNLTSAISEESKHSKKKSEKIKKNNLKNLIDNVEISEEKTEKDEAKTCKASKRKLYASDHELKDVDSNATDDSFINTNNFFKKTKNSKKETDVRAKSVEEIIRSELTLKNLNKDNEIVSAPKHENNSELEITDQKKPKTKVTKKSNNKATHRETEEESQLEKVTNSIEDDKEMFDNMFRESFLTNVSMVEEDEPIKKKAKKRKNAGEDVNSEAKVKTKKKSKAEEVGETIALAKPIRSRKKFEKPKEEPASLQIMKLINNAFKSNNKKLNSSTSSNESRYGALDIDRVSTKNNYSSSSSSDEREEKYSKPAFQIRDKSREKELVNPSTSSCSTTSFKKEVKDDKKQIKKVHFDE